MSAAGGVLAWRGRACVTLPPDTFRLTPGAFEQRQIETRKYSGIEEKELPVACSTRCRTSASTWRTPKPGWAF
jgi:hypothetical protein